MITLLDENEYEGSNDPLIHTVSENVSPGIVINLTFV